MAGPLVKVITRHRRAGKSVFAFHMVRVIGFRLREDVIGQLVEILVCEMPLCVSDTCSHPANNHAAARVAPGRHIASILAATVALSGYNRLS